VWPEGYDAWNNIGGLYFQLNKPEKAREMWERSVAIQPNFGALSNLGAVAFMTGDFELASERYRQALDLNASDHRLWFNYAGALAEFAPDRANDAYVHGLELAEARRRINPRDSELLAQMADAYASSGKPDRAVSMIERALTLDPANVDLKVTAGCVYELCGDRDKAVRSIDEALEHGLAYDYVAALPVLEALLQDPQFDRYRNAGEPVSSDSA
jgi:tetratricopeptide (TPR) repeat protein